MADFKENESPFIKGSKHTVTIEESGKDLIVVCLNFQSYVYRGVLLNSTLGNVPYGVNLPRKNTENEFQKQDEEIPVIKDLISVSNRHSFLQVPGAQIPVNTQSTVKALNKSWKEKTIRNIRLRPRQVLCSKCKSTCPENPDVKAPSNSTAVTKSVDSKPEPIIKSDIHTRKRSIGENLAQPVNPVTKKIKSTDNSSKKRSPVIKISFNTPQGKGTVVKIPPKIQNQEQSDSEYDTAYETSRYHHHENIGELSEKSDIEKTPRGGRTPEYGSDIGIYGHKKVKKSLRKAKEKERLKVTLKAPFNSNVRAERPHKKKHKDRHRKKQKHKHKHSVRDQEVPGDEMPDQENAIQIVENKDGIPLIENLNMAFEASSKSPKPRIHQTDGLVTRLRRKRPTTENDQQQTDNYVLSNGDNLTNRNANSDCGDSSPIDVERLDRVKPLMMRIHTQSVEKCIIGDSRYIATGDIVWGKILGFPWWPGKILNITVSQKDNGVIIRQMAHVTWFGSSTMSNMPCCELYPFLDDFRAKYNKKKRGPYKLAIKQATVAAKEILGIQPDEFIDVEGLEDI
ncbi:PWWP domain-containing protein 2B-like [Tubulanus polymorphus]|uniref:PWWP domain-containing protein 2B-like n=1 Tax=Tubulanus polymorphus TaxID=672921 RepID=UPI003DA5C827